MKIDSQLNLQQVQSVVTKMYNDWFDVNKSASILNLKNNLEGEFLLKKDESGRVSKENVLAIAHDYVNK